MIDDAVIANDLRREHAFKFFARVGAMSPKLIEQRDALAWNVAQMLQQPGNEPMIRRGSRDVRKADANAVVRLDPFAERARFDRFFQRLKNGLLLIGQTGRVRRLDDSRPLFRQLDGQVPASVSKLDFHDPSIRG